MIDQADSEHDQLVTDSTGDVPRLLDDLLTLVKARTGFALVMVTRRLGDDWQVVHASGNPYGVLAGDTLRWSDSVCSRMVASGEPGPWLVPDVDLAGVGDAPVRRHKAIRAYAGVPLLDRGGAFLGTLCAIDPEGRPVGDADLFAFAETFASWALDRAATSAATDRAAERQLLRDDAEGATTMPADAWTRLLETEATRTLWTGEPFAVVLVRRTGDGQGRRGRPDALAAALAEALDEADAVAVLGSNRVGVLSIGRPMEQLDAVLRLATAAEPGTWAGAEVAGSEPIGSVVAELERQLVGDAAPARAASQLVVYRFCAECGLKGVYLRPGTDMSRCKYCREIVGTA